MTQGQTRGQFPRKRRCVEGSKTWAWRGQTDWAPQIRTNLYEICVASNLTRNLWQLLNTAQYGLAPCECVPLSDDSRVRKWVLPSTRGGCLCRRSEHQHVVEGLCRRHEKGRRASSNYSAATWAESRIWKMQSCLILQGSLGRFHEKKVARLLDFVQMRGGGPAQIFCHTFINAFLVNKRSLFPPKCQ